MKSDILTSFLEKQHSRPEYEITRRGIEKMMQWNIALGNQAICMMSGAMEDECDELMYPFQEMFYNEIEECLDIEICTGKSRK